MTTLPDGAFPVMLTPFHPDRSIDWATLDRYTDWLVENGCAGLFPVALSGEMYELDEAERLDVATRVVARSARRVPVLASVVLSGTAAEYAAAAARVAATGVDVVVLIASMVIDEGEAEALLLEKVSVVLAENPGVDFGIYECPLPYHRILSTDAVKALAQTGRFTFFKETSHDVALMADRVAVSAGTPMKVYNAGIETLVPSLAVGVSGLSGWVVNVFPSQVVWLCENAASIGTDAAMDAQNALDRVERGMGPTYPTSAKYILAAAGGLAFPLTSRWNPTPIDVRVLDGVIEEFRASSSATLAPIAGTL